MTEDIDVTPATDRANLDLLAIALGELDARLRTATEAGALPLPTDAEVLTTRGLWTLTTSAGDLGICFTPSGTRGYDDLRREATRERLGRG